MKFDQTLILSHKNFLYIKLINFLPQCLYNSIILLSNFVYLFIYLNLNFKDNFFFNLFELNIKPLIKNPLSIIFNLKKKKKIFKLKKKLYRFFFKSVKQFNNTKSNKWIKKPTYNIHFFFYSLKISYISKKIKLSTPFFKYRRKLSDKKLLKAPKIRLKFNKSINNFWLNQKLLIDLLNFNKKLASFSTNIFLLKKRYITFITKWTRFEKKELRMKEKDLRKAKTFWFLNSKIYFNKNLRVNKPFKTFMLNSYWRRFRYIFKKKKHKKNNVLLKPSFFSKKIKILPTFKYLDQYLPFFKTNNTLFKKSWKKKITPFFSNNFSIKPLFKLNFSNSIIDLRYKNFFKVKFKKIYFNRRFILNRRLYSRWFNFKKKNFLKNRILKKTIVLFFFKFFFSKLSISSFWRLNSFKKRSLKPVYRRYYKYLENTKIFRKTKKTFKNKDKKTIFFSKRFKNLLKTKDKKRFFSRHKLFNFNFFFNKTFKINFSPFFLKKVNFKKKKLKTKKFNKIIFNKIKIFRKHKKKFKKFKPFLKKKYIILFLTKYGFSFLKFLNTFKKSSVNNDFNFFKKNLINSTNSYCFLFLKKKINFKLKKNLTYFFSFFLLTSLSKYSVKNWKKQEIVNINIRWNEFFYNFWFKYFNFFKKINRKKINKRWNLWLYSSCNMPFKLSNTGFLFLSTLNLKKSTKFNYNKLQLKSRVLKHQLSFLYKNNIKRIFLKKPGFRKLLLTFAQKKPWFKNQYFNSFFYNNFKSSFNSFSLIPDKPGLISKFFQKSVYKNRINKRFIKFIKPHKNIRIIPIKRIRFKPGYQRIWRNARSCLNFHLNLNFKYQSRLTRKLLLMRRIRFIRRFSIRELILINFLLNSRFIFDIRSSYDLLNSGLVFVNGYNSTNSNLQLFLGDFIQLYITLKYYITYRWFHNWRKYNDIKFFKLLRYRRNTSRVDLSKQVSKHLPDWIYRRHQKNLDIPKYVEMDFFTLSSFIIFEPLFISNYTSHNYLQDQTLIYDMYNWKYIN